MQFMVGFILIFLYLGAALGQDQTVTANDNKKSTWRFAVSGDSRNCGDVVMAAIAKKVRAEDTG